MKILLLTLLPFFATSQKWFKITKNDIGVIVTQAIAGTADGYNQNIIHHRFGIDKPFWDNKTSWQRKYKSWPEDTRAAYPFSKNLLVWTTDGFHLTRMINRTATLATIGIVAGEFKQYKKGDRWKVVAKKIALSIIANRVAFLIIYK